MHSCTPPPPQAPLLLWGRDIRLGTGKSSPFYTVYCEFLVKSINRMNRRKMRLMEVNAKCHHLKTGGVMGFCCRPYTAGDLHYKIARPTSNKNLPWRGGGLRQINTGRRVPLQVIFFKTTTFCIALYESYLSTVPILSIIRGSSSALYLTLMWEYVWLQPLKNTDPDWTLSLSRY